MSSFCFGADNQVSLETENYLENDHVQFEKMNNADESHEGAIVSDFPDLELPCLNIWSYHYPLQRKYWDLTAFVEVKTNRSYTYKELIESSLRFAKELEKYVDFNAGDRVAIIMPNNIEYPLVELGTFAIGAAICLIREEFQPDIALDILKEVNPKVIVIDSSLLDKFKGIFPQLQKVVKIFVRGSNEMYPEGEDLNSILYSNREGLALEKAFQVDPETVAVVSNSSGTTGKPKAIIMTQKTIVNLTVLVTNKNIFPARRAEEGGQDSMIVYISYAHMAILHYTLAATVVGCKWIESSSDDVLKAIAVINKFKIRLGLFRSYMIDFINKSEEDLKEKLSSLEVVINIGCSLNPDSARELEQRIGKEIYFAEAYGVTEVGGVLYAPKDGRPPESTGRVMSNIKVRVVDFNTNKPILTPNTHGEFQVQTPGVMKGYLNNPEATKEAFDGKWFRTGDICYFDKDYNFYIIERFTDLITLNGKKIFPSAIEEVIKKHDAVTDVGVVGVPDLITREEVPRAFIIRNRSVSEEEIKEFMKKNAPQEEMGDVLEVTFVNTLPRNHLGKLIRKVLREMGWAKKTTF